jgi:hypothetical protein
MTERETARGRPPGIEMLDRAYQGRHENEGCDDYERTDGASRNALDVHRHSHVFKISCVKLNAVRPETANAGSGSCLAPEGYAVRSVPW